MFQWLTEHPKVETLFYSCIWLFFMAFPTYDALSMPNGWRKWLYLAAIIAFIAAYVRVWIVYPTLPRSEDYRVPPGLYLTVICLCALEWSMTALADATVTQLGTYALAVIAFAFPRRQGKVSAILVLTSQLPLFGWQIETGALTSEQAGITLFFLIVMFLVFYGLSSLLISERDLRTSNQMIRQLTQAQERERISSDLHNILGQSLTAIALKSQLTAKLLSMDDAEAKQRAAAEVDAIRGLAAEALADVRSVVRDARQLTLEEEILAARELLLAADLTLVVTGEDFECGQAQQQAAAHVVREAAANIVHHAFATRCEIRTWKDGVRIEDDGVGRASGQVGGRSGTGLKALSARVAEAGGELEYGRGNRGWQVTATFGQRPSSRREAAVEDGRVRPK
ncbi:MAG: histidine kinase [Actinomycetaceae bacterium]|nr:histidine kinase [Actinomycetaceae bacterium]